MDRRPFILPAAALACIVALSSCATPQYRTQVRLIPPTGAQGLACVQACERQKDGCQAACQTRYQACTAALGPKLETAYRAALKDHEHALNRYAAALRHYAMRQHLDWLNPAYPPYGPYYPHLGYPRLSPSLPPPYPAPVMPTREGVRARLEATNCAADCGCLPAYDGCFIGCGGQRQTETLCVRNCPAAR